MNRRINIGAACLAFAISAALPEGLHAQEVRPKTCLVLGGGGARGAAHIGVLEVLERERIPIAAEGSIDAFYLRLGALIQMGNEL